MRRIPMRRRMSWSRKTAAELLREGVHTIIAYLSFWHLELYELLPATLSGTCVYSRLCGARREERVRLEFDQWRPYVTKEHAGGPTPLVQLEQWEAAVNVLDAGIRGSRILKSTTKEKAGQVGELNFLQRWEAGNLGEDPAAGGKVSTAGRPQWKHRRNPIDQLRTDLGRAIADERYEDASRLRDDLRRLEEPPPPQTGTWTG